MTNRISQIYASFSEEQRSRLLDKWPPVFGRVWCRQLVWAYNSSPELFYPYGPLTLTIDGYHCDDRHEALCGYLQDIDGAEYRFRPDGSLIYIALSSDNDVPPYACGEFGMEAVEPVGTPLVTLNLQLQTGHAVRLPRTNR